VENLVCGYDGVRVLNGVSFAAAPHEKLFVIGPNGCGKTTLLRALAGLIPYSGSVRVDGADAAPLSRKQRSQKIALLTQLATVTFSYSVLETVLQGRYAHLQDGFFKSHRPSDRNAALSCLEATGLSDLKDKNIRELSGGQLQRVFLARALAQEPQIILLDEPTNHLDFRYQLELMSYLDSWVRQPGRIVIGVMHDINLALSSADRLLILKNGGVFAQGKTSELDLALIDQTFDADVRAYMVRSLGQWT